MRWRDGINDAPALQGSYRMLGKGSDVAIESVLLPTKDLGYCEAKNVSHRLCAIQPEYLLRFYNVLGIPYGRGVISNLAYSFRQ